MKQHVQTLTATCEVSGHGVFEHFADVGKMVALGSGSKRELNDVGGN